MDAHGSAIWERSDLLELQKGLSARDVSGLSLWWWFTGIAMLLTELNTPAQWDCKSFISKNRVFLFGAVFTKHAHTAEISLSYLRKWNETLVAVYCILRAGWMFVPLSLPLQQEFNSVKDPSWSTYLYCVIMHSICWEGFYNAHVTAKQHRRE